MNDKFSVWVRDHKDENLRWEKEWGFSTDSEYAGRKLDEIMTYMKETRPAEPGRFELAVMKGKGEDRTVHDGPFWVVPPVVLEVIVGEHKFRFPDDEGEKNSDGEGMNPVTEGHDTVTDDFKEDPEMTRKKNRKPETVTIDVPTTPAETTAIILNMLNEDMAVFLTDADPLPVPDVNNAEVPLRDPEAIRDAIGQVEEARRLPERDEDGNMVILGLPVVIDDETADGLVDSNIGPEEGDASGEAQGDGDTTPPATGDGETRTRRRNPDNKTGRIREARRVFDLAEGHLKAGRLDEVLALIDQGAEITPPGVAKAEVQLVARAANLKLRLAKAQELAVKAAETPVAANG